MQTWVWRAFVLVDYGKPDLSVNTVNMGRDVGTVSPDEAIDRAARLYGFLLERQKRRTSSVTDLRRYHRVLWLGTLPPDAAVTNAAYESTEDDAWLVMDRTEHPNPPEPPEDLEPWMDLGALEDWQGAPPPLLVTDHTKEVELYPRYDRWCADWNSWAEEQRSRAGVVAAYRELYAIHQDAHTLSEQYELVLAVGLLSGRSGRQHIRRHLVTTPASIDLDMRSGRLRVGPAAEGSGFTLEEEMLDGADGGDSEAVSDQLTAAGNDPFGDDVHKALEVWAYAHGPSTRYLRQPEPHQDLGDDLRISHAPALILRERTRRAYVDAFATLEKAVRDTRHIPEALRDLLFEGTEAPHGHGGEATEKRTTDLETYFPAPSNEEQRRIVERLRRDRTVVVQGPPGTGKTHTIANLITDLLAHGNRVLVTSHTGRALEELRDKLPEQIQDLCVSMAGDSNRGQRGLEQSVQTLLGRLGRYNKGQARTEQARLRQKLDSARKARAEASRRLRETREHELYRYEPIFGDYQGTAATIAERLRSEEAELGWLGAVPKRNPTITGDDVLRFLRLHHAVTPEVRRRAADVPSAKLLVPPEQFSEIAERYAAQEAQASDQRAARESPQYLWLLGLSPDQRSMVDSRHRQVEELCPQVADINGPLGSAVQGAWSGRYEQWREQRDRIAVVLDKVRALLEQVGTHQITGLSGVDAETAFRQVSDLRERVTAGKKLTGLVGGRSRPVKEARTLLDQVRVDAARPDRRPDLIEVLWTQLAAEVELEHAERELDLPSTGPVAGRLGRLTDEHRTVGLIVAFGDALAALGATARAPFSWTTETLDMTRAALRALALDELRAQVTATVEPTRHTLRAALARPHAAPSVDAALRALDDWDAEAYAAAARQLESVRQANELLTELDTVRAAVTLSHPSLVAMIEADPDNPAWPERLTRFTDAWNWSVWDAEINELADPTGERRLLAGVDQAERDEREALCDLAASLAWDSCLSRVNPADRLNLNGYVKAVKRIGKGTGKYVNRYRAEAREHLNKCQHAVPAWIMPLYRVADSIPMATPNLFDVAIIDEASQSGPEALLLLWLARRIVVVGDDQQVSPEEVGLDRGEIQRLIDSRIPDVPARSLLQVGSSFFDLAMASGATVRLLEHFRCMPEIIAFSNEECYAGDLRPLRQYGQDRLEPLRHTYVENAVVIGQRSKIGNETEADALVEQVVRCCADPAYAGCSMGVITLQGGAQQKLIEDRLMTRLSVTEIQERRLRVGNPESFQGAERSVIFLSMVVAVDGEEGTRRIVAQTREDARRRFNVAASRARDQVWLFHSVHLGDLSPEDLRYRYLEFVSRPPAEQDELELAGVTRDVRVPPFDSLFEQRVYLDIRARGFRVRPQYPALGYYIDLVVEGGTSRLAVECDGDAFHGPDRADYDGARERDLRRVGWEVWRLRASTYSRHQAKSLEPLWQLLDERGIRPLAPRPLPQAPLSPGSGEDTRPSTSDTALPTSARPRVAHRTPRAMSKARPVQSASRVETVRVAPVRGESHPEQTGGSASLVLPAAALNRLRQERERLRAELAEQPELTAAVDRAAAQAQQHDHEVRRQRFASRLAALDRLLDRATVGPKGISVKRAYPGCVIVVRDDSSRERYAVTIAEVGEADARYEVVKPDSAMGRALTDVVVGRSVSFETPRGPRVVHVLEIRDDLPES